MDHRPGIISSGLPGGTERLGASPVFASSARRRARATPRSRAASGARSGLGLAWGTVQIVEHEPLWTARYQEEKARISERIGGMLVDIQHVGSTAVPGLAAKPIIDIAIALDRLEQVSALVDPLKDLGYEFMSEIKIPGEFFFKKNSSDFHVHVLERNSADWMNYLFFRDYLRANPEVAQQYIDLKRDLAARHHDDRPSYTRGKADFIRQVLSDARAWHERRSRTV
ncbi:MAG TPA: GrpB family protein [Armatimonadota bacterium]|nr:GrpB family protein [Armatimonadota bacterium]